MNNNPCIIIAIEGNGLLMDIRRVPDNPGNSQGMFVISALVPQHIQVCPKFSPALWRVPKLITITPMVLLYQSSEIPITPVPVIRDPSYSEGRLQCPPRVRYSPEIDASKLTLHILSDTPGVFQRLKYILLMCIISMFVDNIYRGWCSQSGSQYSI